MQDQNFINSKLTEFVDAGIQRFWIGLTVDQKGMLEWETGANVSYTNWLQENNQKEAENDRCVQIITNDILGRWQEASTCNEPKSFICKIPTGVPVKKAVKPIVHYSCANGWIALSQYCYKFFNAPTTWAGAKSVCESGNAHLIKAATRTSQSVLRFPVTIHRNFIWIGLNDREEEGKMVWESDRAQLNQDTAKWKPGEPNGEHNENCVASSLAPNSGFWSDFDCQKKFAFVCQRLADNIPDHKGETTPTEPPPVNPACGPEWEIDPTNENCYHFSDEQLTWSDAKGSCKRHGGFLLSITGQHEQFYIAGRIKSMQSFAPWIGINDAGYKGEFGYWQWTDGSPMSYFNWKVGQPEYDVPEYKCGMMNRNEALWISNKCSLRNGYICKKKALIEKTTALVPTTPLPDHVEVGCPKSWKLYNGNCYKLIKELYSWEDSRKYCHIFGADLASIHNEEEEEFLKKILNDKKKKLSWAWIGFSDAYQKGIYKWSDESQVTFTNWHLWEPNNFEDENCVLFVTKAGWSNYKCNAKEASICKKAAKEVKVYRCWEEYLRDYLNTLADPQQVFVGNLVQEKYGFADVKNYPAHLCPLHIRTRKTWQDAKTYCSKHVKGELMIVNSEEKQLMATEGIHSTDLPFWISLESAEGSFQKWKNNETVDLKNGTCLAISGPKNEWIGIPCGETNYFICARNASIKNLTSTTLPVTTATVPTMVPPAVPSASVPSIKTTETILTCPRNWIYFQNSCYKEFDTRSNSLDWFEAKDSCKKHSASLVSIDSNEELSFILTNVIKKMKNDYWINNEPDYAKAKDFYGYDYDLSPSDLLLCSVISRWHRSTHIKICTRTAEWICEKSAMKTEEIEYDPTKEYLFELEEHCITEGPDKEPNYNGSCYDAGFKKYKWHDSKIVCEYYYKRVVSIHSKEENDYLISKFTAARYYWIGMHTHSLSHDRKWADGTVIDYTNWDTGEPGDQYKKPCVALDTVTGKWHTFNCYNKFPAICKGHNGKKTPVKHHETELTGGCMPGFVPYGNKCFMIGGTGYQQQLNWKEAETKCKSYGKLFGLASVQDMYEQAFLTLMMKSLNVSLWIGMRRYFGFVAWENNSPLSYFSFTFAAAKNLLGDPRDKCIATHTESNSAGNWFASNCEKQAGYICQGYRDVNLPLLEISGVYAKLKEFKYGNANYTVVSGQNMTWNEAEDFCHKYNGHLVSIADAYENEALLLMSKNITDKFWIGAVKRKNKIVWSDGWPMHYSTWIIRMFEEVGCGISDTKAFWKMVKCNDNYDFICKSTTDKPPKSVPRPPIQNGKCPKNWYHTGKKCMLIKTNPLSWPDSNFVCQQNGATLPSFHSPNDITAVKNILRSISSLLIRSIWIGLNQNTGVLSWTDGSNIDFIQFMHGAFEENHASYFSVYNTSLNCFKMDYYNDLWRRVSCFEKSPFLCMKDPLLEATSDSSDCLNCTKLENGTDVCYNCTKTIPSTESSTEVSTAGIIAICLIIPLVLLVLALIPYYIMKRKTEAASPETESFLNSVYESPNFMVMNPT
ncbi:C-type mannose receptor 2-like isoform X1 [Argonauta hians]